MTLNAVDHGLDDITLEYIIRNAPAEQMGGLLKSIGFETQETDTVPEACRPLTRSEICDLAKALKAKTGSVKDKRGKTHTKTRRQVLVHGKYGTYLSTREVNVGVEQDAKLSVNPLAAFDEKVRRDRTARTQHLTEEAATIADMLSTPEGRAAYNAINKAIGTGARNGRLSPNLKCTNIRYCKDPVESYDDDGNPQYYPALAIVKMEGKGKDQYFYSQEFVQQAKEQKMRRAMVLASPAVQKQFDRAIADVEDADIRDCLKLMYNYGMKSGNEQGKRKNQLGDFVTQGATTLTAGNVFIEKKRARNRETQELETVEKVFVQYYQQGETGNKGHQISLEITDPALAARLKEKKAKAAGDDTRLFRCTKDQTLAVTQELFSCTNEDLRAAFGIKKAVEAQVAMLGKNPLDPKRPTRLDPETGQRKELTMKQTEMEIVDYVARELGVERRSAKEYVQSKLIGLFKRSASLKPKKKKKKVAGPPEPAA